MKKDEVLYRESVLLRFIDFHVLLKIDLMSNFYNLVCYEIPFIRTFNLAVKAANA